MTKQLNAYLHSRWIKDNHKKYHKYFEEWVKNITPNQIHYFTIDMIKSDSNGFSSL